MKISDLVTGRKGCEWIGSVGLVIGFDGDSDPIVVWTHGGGSHVVSPGDLVISGKKEGTIIRFQPKTQDIIVKDKKGEVQVFPWLGTFLKKNE